MEIDKYVLKELYNGYVEMLGAIGYQLDLDIDTFTVKLSDISGNELIPKIEDDPATNTRVVFFEGKEKEHITLVSNGEFMIVYPNGLEIHLGKMFDGPNIKIISPKEDNQQKHPYSSIFCDCDIIEFTLGEGEEDENVRGIHVTLDKNLRGTEKETPPDELFITQEKTKDGVKAYIDNDVFSDDVTPIQADVGTYYGIVKGFIQKPNNYYIAPVNTQKAYEIALPAFKMLLNDLQYTKVDNKITDRLTQLMSEREMIVADREKIEREYREALARIEDNLKKTDAAIESCKLELSEERVKLGQGIVEGISLDTIDQKIKELEERIYYAEEGYALDPDVMDAANPHFEPEDTEQYRERLEILRLIRERIKTM